MNMRFDVKRNYILYLLKNIENKEFVDYTTNKLDELDTLEVLNELIFNLENIIQKTYPKRKIDKMRKCIITDIKSINNISYTLENGIAFGKTADNGQVIKLTDDDIILLKKEGIQVNDSY